MISHPANEIDALLSHVRDRPSARACSDVASGSTAMASGERVRQQANPAPWWTWDMLAAAVWRLAKQLEVTGRDLPCHQRRLIHECHNSVDDVVIALACSAAAWTDCPIDVRLPRTQSARLRDRLGGIDIDSVQHSKPRSSSASMIDELQSMADRINVDATSLILWTSGTTGSPQGVPLSQRNLISNAIGKLAAVPQTIHDRRFTVLPISHAYARTCDMGTWLMTGGQLRLGRGRRDLPSTDDDFFPTHINTVPTIAAEILSQMQLGNPAWKYLRVLGCGGAAVSQRLLDEFAARRIEVIQGYGLTEASPVVCSAVVRDSAGLASPRAAGVVGPPINGVEIQRAGQRLYIRGPGVMRGYLDDADATAARIDRDRWLDTGDLVEIRDDGNLMILGRDDDVIVLPNGYKIHPQAIERIIQARQDVEHAVLTHVTGELVLAIQSDSNDLESIRQETLSHLPPNSRLQIHTLSPPLSADELTAKLTPRRHLIAARVMAATDE